MAKGSRQYGNYDSRANRIAGGILIIIISIIATLSLLNIMGGVGRMISGFLIGVFGYASFAYAFCGIFIGAMVTLNKRVTLPINKAIKYFTLFALGVIILHVWFSRDYFLLATNDAGKYVCGKYLGALYRGESAAGLLGGIFAWIMMRIFTPAYSLVVLIILFAIVSIISFYPVLVNKTNYRTKSTKIRTPKKGEPVLTDMSNIDEKPVERQVGNSLFVGTINEDGSVKKTKKQKHGDFSLLFPNQDTQGVNEDNVTEPIDNLADERRLAKEKLFGKRDDNTIVNDSGVVFDVVKGEEDVTPSLKNPGATTFNRDKNAENSTHRPQSLTEAFNLPESDDDKAKDFQERYGYILNKPTTADDIHGAASKNLAEPKWVKEPETPEIPEKKEDKGEDMPYFIRDILYGKPKKEEIVSEEPTNKFEEVVEPSIKPIEKPKTEEKPEEIKPVEKQLDKKPENKSDDTGSIFTLFGAPLPDKKNSGTVKPVNKAIEKPIVDSELKPIEKPDVYVRSATPTEKAKGEEKILPKLNGDGYNSGYTPDNTPAEKPLTRFEEMQRETQKSNAVMPTQDEIQSTLNPVKEKHERAERTSATEKTIEKKQDTSYTNNFNIGKGAKPVSVTPEKKKPEQLSIDQAIIAEQQKKPYMAPPIDLLQKMDDTIVKEDYTERSQILEQALSNFRIDAKVIGVTQGPTFSRFELQMPVGVPVSSVTKYADDIAMALELTSGVRFETPIPGKNAFGVEIANKVKTPVGLRSVIESEKFNTSKSVMTFALGKDISNDDVVCDLDSMPHLLIAGGTGSGKSVCINALILSLLYRNGPNDLKLILIDPKMVEMTPYNGLPHLLVPEAIKDVNVAINALDWAIKEMERRYKIFVGIGRNIDDYNEYASTHEGVNKLPRIVIVFDELADFMNKAKRQIEEKIASLASLSRAAGIHLIISTQRPSVDIITGTIKTNLPSRIALSLKTAADSTTILGQGGAEKLLGYGDMLYYPVAFNSPHRLQGCFVKTSEVFAVVNYIKEHNESYYDPEIKNIIFKSPDDEDEKEEKEMNPSVAYAHAAVGKDGESQQFIDALYMCVKEQKASISRIQRKFNVGYGTAANIVELMEEKGYVSPNKGGNTQRDVLISMEQYYQIYGNRDETTEFDLPEGEE